MRRRYLGGIESVDAMIYERSGVSIALFKVTNGKDLSGKTGLRIDDLLCFGTCAATPLKRHEGSNIRTPRSLQTILHNISLLCSTVGEPATCKGRQRCPNESGHGLVIPREKIETLRPVGPRWRKTYVKSISRAAL